MVEYNPYRALWSAVVIQAFRDLKKTSFSGEKSTEDPMTIRASAFNWINESSGKYVNRKNSFRAICELLEVDYRELQTLSMSREGVDRFLSGKFNLENCNEL